MFLAIDIGNSDIVFGINESSQWKHIFRIASDLSFNPSDYEAKLRLLFLEYNLEAQQISEIALSTVVPNKTLLIQEMCLHFFGIKPLTLGPDIYKKLPINVLRPHEIGSDLVCNAMYAFSKKQAFCTIIDFGTALTCTTIDRQGNILGVSIAPGMYTAVKSLFSNTAQLPEVPLELPSSVLGQNTVHAIQAGVTWGYVGMVKQLIENIKTELSETPYIIATGGLGNQLKPALSMVNEFNKNATLDGLMLINKILREN